MKTVELKIDIMSCPIYGEIEDGAILKDSDDYIPTITVEKNLPPHAQQFSQFDFADWIRADSGVVDFSMEDPPECWLEEDQEKIRKSWKKFHTSYTRIVVIPCFEGKQLAPLKAKKFGTSFEVPNDKVQEAIEFCQGIKEAQDV